METINASAQKPNQGKTCLHVYHSGASTLFRHPLSPSPLLGEVGLTGADPEGGWG